MSAEALVKKKVALSDCKKLFVQRDYSRGLGVCFYVDYPEELSGKVSRESWQTFINHLNTLYAQAEENTGSSIAESLLSFATCNLSRLCVKSLWTKKLEEVRDFLDDINQNTYIKRGIYVMDPIEKGLRVIEIALLEEPVPAPHAHNHNSVNANQLQPR